LRLKSKRRAHPRNTKRRKRSQSISQIAARLRQLGQLADLAVLGCFVYGRLVGKAKSKGEGEEKIFNKLLKVQLGMKT
jgi:hypothetical protein